MAKEEEIVAAKTELKALRREMAKVGLLSHGYVQDRGPGAGGPCYQWTRKVKAKTVSVALSKEQFEAMSAAIDNWKSLKSKLSRMEELVLVRDCLCIYENQVVVTLPRSASFLMQAAFLEWS